MENEQLKNKIAELEKELEETKEHLKRYTAPAYKKVYYETHKNEIKEKKKTYVPTEEQKKKWARQAYLNKKAKMKENENV